MPLKIFYTKLKIYNIEILKSIKIFENNRSNFDEWLSLIHEILKQIIYSLSTLKS